MSIDKIIGNNDDWEEWDKLLTEELGPLIAKQIIKGMMSAAADVGINLSPEIVETQVAEYIKNYQALAIKQINETTREKLRSVLLDAVENGANKDEIAAAVRGVLGSDASMRRAELVARTELARAHSNGRLQQYKEAGFTKKIWQAGVEACPFCRELDGTVIGIEENFFDKGTQLIITDDEGKEKNLLLDYEDVATQPLHPGCDCDVRYQTE